MSVICPQGKRHDTGWYEERDGVRIYRYPPPPSATSLAGYVREYPFMLWWTLRLARRVWRDHPFDVIHACNPPDLFFLIGWLFRPRGVAFVYDQHDAGPEIMWAKRGGVQKRGFPELVVEWAERFTYALADVVIAPNDSYRRLATTRGHKDPRDVIVVRSAPRREEFSVGRRDFGRLGHRYLVGYLGVMGKQDGVDLLVRAVGLLVREGYDILLYLAGDGESRGEIEDLVRELGIEDQRAHAGLPDPRGVHTCAHERGRLRRPRPAESVQRHLDDEQDHRVHGAGLRLSRLRASGEPRDRR